SIFLFFFSSRRRHTRSKRDWSSDVCSSDLLAFDRSKKKAGTFICGVPIYHIDDLDKKLEDVEVAILTVPASAAQDIADKLIEQGVKGIVNFTPARLTIPEDVRIHHIDLSVELQSFVYFLKNYPL